MLRAVGAAKAAGGIASLYPNGQWRDCPWDLSMAIQEAMIVLGYFERLEEEQPDPLIWHHSERLEEWWEAIRLRKESERSGVAREPVPDGSVENPEYYEMKRRLERMR